MFLKNPTLHQGMEPILHQGIHQHHRHHRNHHMRGTHTHHRDIILHHLHGLETVIKDILIPDTLHHLNIRSTTVIITITMAIRAVYLFYGVGMLLLHLLPCPVCISVSHCYFYRQTSYNGQYELKYKTKL